MKATYQKPETLIARISTMQMIAASPYGENFKPEEEGVNLDGLQETTDVSGNLSRRRTVWDDEEEEDF